MGKRKLLHVQLCPLTSGVQNVTLAILDGLDRDRYDAYVLSQPGGPLVEAVRSRGFTHIPLPSLRRAFSPLDAVALRDLERICREHRFDIVHTHSSKTGFIGRIAARRAGVPKVIHTVHGFPFHAGQPWPLQRAYMELERYAAGFADTIVFVNNEERELAIRRGIVPAAKAVTIHNGVEPHPCRREDWKPLHGKLTVGWSGRFWKQKNPLETVRIACNAATERKELAFVFLGDGEYRAACQRYVEACGLTDRILFPGWQSDVAAWFPRFDVFLLFSRWEGLPLSILEAMAAGLPIIASNIVGNRELVDERNGWRINLHDTVNLERRLQSLPDMQPEILEKGAASLLRVREEYRRDRFIERTMEIYEA